jgi:hypothetical protein
MIFRGPKSSFRKSTGYDNGGFFTGGKQKLPKFIKIKKKEFTVKVS